MWRRMYLFWLYIDIIQNPYLYYVYFPFLYVLVLDKYDYYLSDNIRLYINTHTGRHTQADIKSVESGGINYEEEIIYLLNCILRAKAHTQWVNGSESVLTGWRSALVVWGTHNDSKVSYCLYLSILMLNK